MFLVSVDSDDSSGDEELLNRPLASILFKSQNNEKNGKQQKWAEENWHLCKWNIVMKYCKL